MSEFVATVYVAFMLCVLDAQGSGSRHPDGFKVWVLPEAVTAFAYVRYQVSGIPCTQIKADGSTLYVVGSPAEVYAKLTDAHPD